MSRLVIDKLSDIHRTAELFLEETTGETIFAFYGSMGSGKTTFIKALCEKMGALDTVTSPTFSIINEYFTTSGKLLYHFDFYRIEKAEEALDIGFNEYLESGNICFIEWPEIVDDYLPPNIVRVMLSVDNNMKRILEIDLPTAK